MGRKKIFKDDDPHVCDKEAPTCGNCTRTRYRAKGVGDYYHVCPDKKDWTGKLLFKGHGEVRPESKGCADHLKPLVLVIDNNTRVSTSWMFPRTNKKMGVYRL